ncbi:MAG: SIS domain-containing protein [Cardiobacteriaceae bacterium]|nr:SIS domain-containing protein [Cardiobacteriaceae bacterium]
MYAYQKAVLEMLEQAFREEQAAIDATIAALADAILDKRAIYIFGASHAGILAEEMYYRAGGLMVINPIFGEEIMLNRTPISATSRMEQLEGYGTILAGTVDFRAGDVLIAHSVSGRNAVAIDLVLAAKARGAQIIAITNLAYSQSVTSRHSSGKRLFELADIVIDNHGVIGDAVCELPGISQKVGPTSTVVGAAIMNTIVVEVCKRLIASGMEYPPIYYSANMDGGQARNQALIEQYQDVIRYRF